MARISRDAVIEAQADQISREEWLDIRRKGIGGSDASAIVGANKWKSAYSLWLDKTAQRSSTDNTNEAMEWGNDLELVVAQRYAKQFNKTVVAYPVVLRSINHSFMLANVDFFIVPNDVYDDLPVGEVSLRKMPLEYFYDVEAILEIKTTGIVGRASTYWDNDQVPIAYELQGQHYALVTGVEDVVFAALVAGQGLQVRTRRFNDNTANAKLIRAEERFWTQVTLGQSPEVDGSSSTLDALKSQYPTHDNNVVAEADDFVADAVREYRGLQKQIQLLEEMANEKKAQIQRAMGNAAELTYNGETLATWRANRSSTTVDTKSLLAYLEVNMPQLIQNYTIEKQGVRVLRFKGEK